MVTDATKLLLLWFEQDELDDCPDCGQKHLLPDWGSPHGRSCASCGFIRQRKQREPATGTGAHRVSGARVHPAWMR